MSPRGRGDGPIWCLAAGLAAGALVLAGVVLPALPPPAAPLGVPFWLLALAWFLAEAAVVHYHFRATAQSFSVSEVPLVLGLFLADPQELVPAVVLGAGAALVLVRRQAGLKVAVNLAHLAFGACLAVLVFRVLGGEVLDADATAFGPAAWLAALAAALVAAATSTTAILVAIWQSEGVVDLRRLPEQIALTLFTSGTSVSLGLLAVGATVLHPAAVAILVVPAGTMLVAHRSVVVHRRERDNLELLHSTARVLDEAPDVVTAMRDLVRSASATLRAGVAQLALVSQNDPGLVLVASTTDGRTAESRYVRLEDLDPALRRALRATAPDLVALSPPLPGPGGAPLRQVMVAPLGEGPQSRGVVLVADRTGPDGSFGPFDLKLLETLAAQVAVSLDKGRLARALAETARRADRERQNALVLQRGILPPPLPRVPGAAVAVRYLPGTADAEVGGDWYDVIPLPDGDVGFAIGDVLGHDLEAAARMGQARSALRAFASEGHGPAAVVQRLNRLLSRTDPDFMGTCCYLQFSPARSTVTLVSAGHPPPLLLVPGERPRLLPVEANLPLGVLDDTEYSESTVELSPGATLAIYTDGLVESKTMPLDVGLSRLTALRTTEPGDDVETLAERLVATAPAGTVGDDLTLLLLQQQPAPTRRDAPPAPRDGTAPPDSRPGTAGAAGSTTAVL